MRTMQNIKRMARLTGIGILLVVAALYWVENNYEVPVVNAAPQREPLPPQDSIVQLPADGGEEFNRLIFEVSPYLLQHARNPVDWYPWGDHAFEKARREDKVVFLSIGYSTCHWCHVMEHESFEDEEVAAVMNADFVSIKVDREERPDIDDIYMTVTQAITGSGGWPMTVFLTPDRKPIRAGTYFTKPQMLQLLPQVANVWKSDREKVLGTADRITQYLQETTAGSKAGTLDATALTTAYNQLNESFDTQHGGFLGDSREHKFPTPHRYTFLLRHWRRTGDAKALEIVEKSLQAMRRGGMYDQLGFGFHRYSTDAEWLAPHFEKMLYDQALLAMAYSDTYLATGKQEYANTLREIFTYVLRDMTSTKGAFFSAEDADSESEEGKFYVWTTDEIAAVLGEEDGAFYSKTFNLKSGGNWQEGLLHRTNIPHLRAPLEAIAEREGVALEQLVDRIEAIHQKLFDVREQRIHPYKDDKILTDWNGLMIAALAQGARALNAPQYAKAAQNAADFFLSTMLTDEGRLHHRYRNGDEGMPAQLEDYAYFVWGLLELYETTFDVKYLQEAIRLNEIANKHYWDDTNGGFFLTADDGEKLLVRPKTIYDGAQPSGNSVAALNLIRIGRITGNAALEEKANEIFEAFGQEVARGASNFTQLLNALDFAVGPSFEVVIAGNENADDTNTMLASLWKQFSPNKVVLFRPEMDAIPPVSKLAPFTENQRTMNGKATAYVCQNYTCNLPTTDPNKMIEALAPSPGKTL